MILSVEGTIAPTNDLSIDRHIDVFHNALACLVYPTHVTFSYNF